MTAETHEQPRGEEQTKQKLEELIKEARTLVEQYANDALKSAQTRLAAALDTSLDQAKDRISKFVTDISSVVQSSTAAIDRRPLVPVALALVGGVTAGLYLGSRGWGTDQLRKAGSVKRLFRSEMPA